MKREDGGECEGERYTAPHSYLTDDARHRTILTGLGQSSPSYPWVLAGAQPG